LLIVSALFLYLILGPNSILYVNIFTIIDELCTIIMFFTAIIFAYLDRIGN